MAWSGLTSYINDFFASPAASYWGTLISGTPGRFSPAMQDLIAAIFRHYSSGNEQLGLSPAAFNRLLSDLSVPALDAHAGHLSSQTQRELAVCYFTGRDMEYSMHVDEDGKSIPLLTLTGLAQWISYQLHIKPEDTLRALNELLADESDSGACLRIPESGENFKYTNIPRECLPPVDASICSYVTKVSEQWLASQQKILDRAQSSPPAQEKNAQSEEGEQRQDAVAAGGDAAKDSSGLKLEYASLLQNSLNQMRQQKMVRQAKQIAMYQQLARQQQQQAAEYALRMQMQANMNASSMEAAYTMWASGMLEAQAVDDAFASNASAMMS